MEQLRHFMDGEHFVVGYLFDDDAHSVVLIDKARPAWQAGLLNGVGGYVNSQEPALVAMDRESREEIDVAGAAWKRFALLRTLQGNARTIVHFFYVRDSAAVARVKQLTDERPVVIPLNELGFHRTVPNVMWFVQMALSMDRDSAAEFLITEQYPEEAAAVGTAAPFDARASWQSEDGATFRLTHPMIITEALGTVKVRPGSDALVGRFAWSVRVANDCADPANPIRGRAYTLEEAKHLVETLLLCTHVLEVDQLPKNSPVQYTFIGAAPQTLV